MMSAILLENAGKTLIEAGIKEFPINYAKEAVNTEGLLRQGVNGALDVAGSTLKEAAQAIVVQSMSQAVYDNEASLEGLKNSGNWDEYTEELIKGGVIDATVSFAAEAIVKGEAPTAAGIIGLMGKIVNTHVGAPYKADAASLDAGKTVLFFNTATAAELGAVSGISEDLAYEIIDIRSAGQFTTVDDVIAVNGFTAEVLTPAAIAVRDDYHLQRDAAAAAAAPAAGG